jgi:predicted dehydrogenase
MSKIKCAVIGVGYLGRFHAQKYNLLENADLIGVSDVNSDACKRVASELCVPGFNDYRVLLDKVDAVSIAATTTAHYEIAKTCLEHGIHCLIEKPITRTKEEADELIAIAKKNKAKIQVGHLERFNAAHLALAHHLDKPLYIDSQRLAPFNPRGADVNVIFDLMIHDIDIIQNIVKSPIVKIDAQGAPVLTASIDIANARITFANKCIANVTASRVSFDTERKTRIFQEKSYISLDYHLKKLSLFTKGDGEMYPGIANICQNEKQFTNSDALLAQINAFLEAITNDTQPLVTGEDGANALDTASKITEQINNNLSIKYAES